MDSHIQTLLLRDKDIAAQLSISPAWVRQQRFKRRRGLPHVLKIDPIMIGSSPRYLVEDVNNFISSLTSANQNDVLQTTDGGPSDAEWKLR